MLDFGDGQCTHDIYGNWDLNMYEDQGIWHTGCAFGLSCDSRYVAKPSRWQNKQHIEDYKICIQNTFSRNPQKNVYALSQEIVEESFIITS